MSFDDESGFFTIRKPIGNIDDVERILYLLLQQLHEQKVVVTVTAKSRTGTSFTVYSTYRSRPLIRSSTTTPNTNANPSGMAGGGRSNVPYSPKDALQQLSLLTQVRRVSNLEMQRGRHSRARTMRGGKKRARDSDTDNNDVSAAHTWLERLVTITGKTTEGTNGGLATFFTTQSVSEINIQLHGPVKRTDLPQYDRLERQTVEGKADYYQYLDYHGTPRILSIDDNGAAPSGTIVSDTLDEIETILPLIPNTKLAYYYHRAREQNILLYL